MEHGKIFCLMGKSSSGKDSIYAQLLPDERLGLSPLVLYTTRPMRGGEKDGLQYRFVTEEQWHKLGYSKIEEREYNTVKGIWRYGTFDDGMADSEANTLCIVTPAMLLRYNEFFGSDRVVTFYIEVDDKTRLLRAIERESLQREPDYSELCRRFLADASDFSWNVLDKCQITRTFVNDDMHRCLSDIKKEILSRI